MAYVPGGWALITGASDGIGRVMARLLVEKGHPVVVVARRVGMLEALAREVQGRVPVVVVGADLSTAGGVGVVLEELEQRAITVDLLVNNAGAGLYGPGVELPWEGVERMLQLNILSLTRLTRELGGQMAGRGRGVILNVASTAGFVPGPWMATYYASKAYVLSFSLAMGVELEASGVGVTTLCPGATFTHFQQAAGMPASSLSRLRPVMSAEEVVACAYRGLVEGRPVVIPGWTNQVMCGVLRRLPWPVVNQLLHRGMERGAR